MAITRRTKEQMEFLRVAILTGNAAVMECQDKLTKKIVPVIIVVDTHVDGEHLIPLAQFLSKEELKNLLPPDPDHSDKFKEQPLYRGKITRAT